MSAKSLLVYSVFILLPLYTSAQSGPKESLSVLLAKEATDTGKVNLLNSAAKELCANHPDSALILSTQALALSQKFGWEIGVGTSYHQIAIVYYYKGDYALSMDYYSKALQIWDKLLAADPKNIRVKRKRSATLGNIGSIYYSQGDYPKALQNYLMILKTDEQLRDNASIAEDYCALGVIYSDQKDYTRSLDYYFKAFAIDKSINSQDGMSADLGNIASVYHQQGEALDLKGDTSGAQQYYIKALDFGFKSLYLREKLDNQGNIATQLGNIGTLYHTLRNTPLALKYLFRALKIYEEMGNKRGASLQMINIGSVYTEVKQFPAAEKFLIKGLALSDSVGALHIKMNAENYLSNLYVAMGDNKKALDHYKKSIILKDTIFNQEKDNEITRKGMTYEFEKKEAAEKALQEKKDEVAAAEKKRQQVFLILSLMLAIAVALIAVIIFRNLQRSRQAKKLIELQRDEITRQKETAELQKQMVEASQKEILDSIHYAKRIQQSLLPTEKYIERNLRKLKK